MTAPNLHTRHEPHFDIRARTVRIKFIYIPLVARLCGYAPCCVGRGVLACVLPSSLSFEWPTPLDSVYINGTLHEEMIPRPPPSRPASKAVSIGLRSPP